MRRALALALCLALPAAAQDGGVSDAPIEFVANPDGSRTVPAASWVRLGKSKAACEAERDSFRAAPPSAPWWVPVLVGVVALGAGVAVGAAVVK